MLELQYNKVKLSVHLYFEKVKNELSIIINSSKKSNQRAAFITNEEEKNTVGYEAISVNFVCFAFLFYLMPNYIISITDWKVYLFIFIRFCFNDNMHLR